MSLTVLLLTFVPTLVWCVIWLWVKPTTVALRWLAAGIALGVLAAVPIWFYESAVDALADPNKRWSRVFIQQVLGAAVGEEGFKMLGVGILLAIVGRFMALQPRTVVAMAISVGIGFMTLENLFGVTVAESPMVLALNRQMTIIAGHGCYQAIMGCLLAKAIQDRRFSWGVLAFVVPVILHGWGDFSDQLFKDEPDPGSAEDTFLFYTWIASILTTAIATGLLLWHVRMQWNTPETSADSENPESSSEEA